MQEEQEVPDPIQYYHSMCVRVEATTCDFERVQAEGQLMYQLELQAITWSHSVYLAVEISLNTVGSIKTQ